MSEPKPTTAKRVQKRDGTYEPYDASKVTRRNLELCLERRGPGGEVVAPRLEKAIEWLDVLTARLDPRLPNGVSTRVLDRQSSALARQLAVEEPELDLLSARIIASDVEKQVGLRAAGSKVGASKAGYAFGSTSRYSAEFVATVERAEAAGLLDGALVNAWSYTYTSFGLLTLLRKYVPKDEAGEPLETPQLMLLRLALAILVPPVGAAAETGVAGMSDAEFAAAVGGAVAFYQEYLATRACSLPTPMCRNSGMAGGNGSSCFLLDVPDDLAGIFDVAKDLALISQAGGGVGLNLSGLRAKGSTIGSTGGRSKGPVSFAQVFETIQNKIDQGGVRNGAFAVSLFVHHADVFDYIEASRILPGREGAPDLNYALAGNDAFFAALAAAEALGGEPLDQDAVAAGAAAGSFPPAAVWHLFDPAECPELFQLAGVDFRRARAEAVAAGRFAAAVDPRMVLARWFTAVKERGRFYSVNLDAANELSNLATKRKNVKSLNLCVEVTLPAYYAEGEYGRAFYGTCNLAAVNLTRFVRPGVADRAGDSDPTAAPLAPHEVFDFPAMAAAAGRLARLIDRVIDLSTSPVAPSARANQAQRPAGIGVMGLADVLAMARIPFDSFEAVGLDAAASAAIYYGAMDASAAMVEEGLPPFPLFPHSYTAAGVLHPDLWFARRARLQAERRGADPYRESEDSRGVTEVVSDPMSLRVKAIADTVIGDNQSFALATVAAMNKETAADAERRLAGWEARIAEATGGWLGPEEWAALRNRVARGVRLSEVTARMPVATTAQVAGVNEAGEPFTHNIYPRLTLAGEFLVVNPYLVAELRAAGVWGPPLYEYLKTTGGSLRNVPPGFKVPADVARRFRTASEMDPRWNVRHAAGASPTVSMSMSLNHYPVAAAIPGDEEDGDGPPTRPDPSVYYNIIADGQHYGLKTLSYYMHSASAGGSAPARSAAPAESAESAESESADSAEPEAAEPGPSAEPAAIDDYEPPAAPGLWDAPGVEASIRGAGCSSGACSL